MIITLVGFARDRFGAGMGSTTIEAYTVNADGTKAATPTMSTFPSSSTGKWVLAGLDTDASPTGVFAIKETYGADIRWIEPQSVIMVTTIIGPNGEAPLLPASVTDAIIGNRTVSQSAAPASHTGDLTTLLSGIVSQLHRIIEKSEWFDAPTLSLTDLEAHAVRHAQGGPDEITPASIGAVAVEDQVGTAPIYSGASGNLIIGTGYAEIPGLLKAAVDAGTHLVMFSLNPYIETADGIITVVLELNGVAEKAWSLDLSSSSGSIWRGTFTKIWPLVLAPGDEVRVRARKSGGSGASEFSGGEMILQWVSA